ncbi:predicted protein [Naegleria gruberi]|uniref:Predicted protein n=1 Tax=Naegleria gruberi TaxID=5762 RepID=D2VIK4_NAEGR|nr:uncharacterized protein NAEGRDRAFT_68710 [Naegleria gruberi]EFC43285.1 predicted protein [Naegleria gruberi]|eukprot:XP_002676029.1 predicted protein [Naegleria gruberi strain NEG-M]
MNTFSYPHTSSVTLPIITYGEVEQFVKDWISTGCSDYLQHVPKNELMAHCYMVGVDKQLIKRAFLSSGKDELIKALISACPIVGSSSAITEDLQTFLNRSHDLYCVIHARGRINSVRQVDNQQLSFDDDKSTILITNHQEGQHNELLTNSSSKGLQPISIPSQTIVKDSCKEETILNSNASSMDEINSPELSSRPRRKIRTSPKDKYRLKRIGQNYRK